MKEAKGDGGRVAVTSVRTRQVPEKQESAPFTLQLPKDDTERVDYSYARF